MCRILRKRNYEPLLILHVEVCLNLQIYYMNLVSRSQYKLANL